MECHLTCIRVDLSLHICSQLRGDLVAMKKGQDNTIVTTHKEETQGRLASDSSDRQKIQNALQSYIDPLATDTHPPGLLNIVTGLHTTDKVNVDWSVEIGRQQLVEFESGWTKSFNKTLSKKVITMASIKRTSSWMVSKCMIQNWSTPVSYVSNSTGSGWRYSVRYGCRIMGWLGTMGWQVHNNYGKMCSKSPHFKNVLISFKINELWLYRKWLFWMLFLFLT